METEFSNYNIYSIINQANDVISYSTFTNEFFVQQNSNITTHSPCFQDQQHVIESRPSGEQNFSEEVNTFNEQQIMLADFEQAYPYGFSEIPEEAMIGIDEIKEGNLYYTAKSTLNSRASTSRTDSPHSVLSDHEIDETLFRPTVKKKRRNENRNTPMLMAMHQARSLRTLLQADLNDVPVHWQYICDILDEARFTREDIPSFLRFLKSLKSAKKTWTGLIEMLQGKDRNYAKLLLICVDGLLSEEGQKDFDNWINNGKMKKAGKNALIEHKNANRNYLHANILLLFL